MVAGLIPTPIDPTLNDIVRIAATRVGSVTTGCLSSFSLFRLPAIASGRPTLFRVESKVD